MDRILALRTTDGTFHKLDMIVISWVHHVTDARYIEISAKSSELDQRLVRIATSGRVEDQRRLSEFHDKLLAALERFPTQITAYLDVATLPLDLIDVDLKRSLVYLLISF